MLKDWTRDELEKHYIGKMKATTIPVNISISGQQRILEMRELENIIRNAKVLSQDSCTCRKKFKHCDKPLEGCIGLDDDAIDSIANNGGKRITAKRALTLLKQSYDAGLVHLAYVFEGKDKIERICSCCSCCCHSLSAAIRFGYSDHVFSSKLIADQNQDKCDNCGACVERCHFGARRLDIETEELVFEQKKCFGCGLCLESCSNHAINMVDR